jgi:Fic family protein
MPPKQAERLYARADAAARIIRRLPPQAALAREMRRIRRAEIVASTALAGSQLSAAEVDALIDRGRAQGNRNFADYVLVRAYADAAHWIADARALSPGDPRPLFVLEEVRLLNTRATGGLGLRGGAWRQSNRAPDAGIVAPAAWMVVRETELLVDRFARGPHAEPVARWLARFIGRFARLQPFEGANGRTARLCANLMLRRLDDPPLVFEPRERRRYPAALAAAETSAPEPLAELIARAILKTCNRLDTTAEELREPVLPLREAAGADYPALAKAAQRGRLRTIVRGGRYFTTSSWIAEYRAAHQNVATR